MAKYGMVIDLEACQGCRTCVEACKIENNTPQHNFWMYVFRLERNKYPEVHVDFLPRPCQHCDNAPCVKVCPVGARFKRDDGLVLTDAERCIGCRYCEVACPYGVNYFNWEKPQKALYFDWSDPETKALSGGAVPGWKNPDLEEKYGTEQRLTAGGGHFKGVIEKCTFCVQRIDKGLTTACAAVCPVNAISFGDLDDPESAPSRILRNRPSFELLPEAGTKPSVRYVGDAPPDESVREIEPIQGRV